MTSSTPNTKLTPNLDPTALDALIGRMLGQPEQFFGEHFRKQPLFAPGAAAGSTSFYDVDDFLRDLAATQPTPYVSVGARDGNRYFAQHETTDALRDAIGGGNVCAIKMSKIWHERMPESWSWFRALFGSLCRYASMLYLSPGRTEDVDLFLAGPNSQLGTHFDSTDVFTVQLFGERRWTVDRALDVEGMLGLSRSSSWYPAKEVDFLGPTQEFVLRPGDALYVPAYMIHRVEGVSWSVSLSLGLRAFTELDVVEHLLEAIRITSHSQYKPLQSVPEGLVDAHVDAKLELMQRVRAVLKRIEGATLMTAAAPLALPSTLAPEPTAVAEAAPLTGMFASGFGLLEGSEPSKS